MRAGFSFSGSSVTNASVVSKRAEIDSDVAQELAREILHRGEDTARNYVALDLGEPDLYLVKPAGVGRSVMHQCVEDHLRHTQTQL